MHGVVIPEKLSDLEQAIETERRAIREKLQGRRVLDFLNRPQATDPWAQAILELLADLITGTYFSTPVHPLFVLKSVNTSLE